MPSPARTKANSTFWSSKKDMSSLPKSQWSCQLRSLTSTILDTRDLKCPCRQWLSTERQTRRSIVQRRPWLATNSSLSSNKQLLIQAAVVSLDSLWPHRWTSINSISKNSVTIITLNSRNLHHIMTVKLSHSSNLLTISDRFKALARWPMTRLDLQSQKADSRKTDHLASSVPKSRTTRPFQTKGDLQRIRSSWTCHSAQQPANKIFSAANLT